MPIRRTASRGGHFRSFWSLDWRPVILILALSGTYELDKQTPGEVECTQCISGGFDFGRICLHGSDSGVSDEARAAVFFWGGSSRLGTGYLLYPGASRVQFRSFIVRGSLRSVSVLLEFRKAILLPDIIYL